MKLVDPSISYFAYVLLVLIAFLMMQDIFFALIIAVHSDVRQEYLRVTKRDPTEAIGKVHWTNRISDWLGANKKSAKP